MSVFDVPLPDTLGEPSATVVQQFFELFGGGPLPQWETVAAEVETLEFPAGEVIFDRGEAHPFVYVVLRGAAKLIAPDARGEEHLVGLARAGELLASVQSLAPHGLAAYVDQDLLGAGWAASDSMGTSNSRAVAVTDCLTARVDFRLIHAMMRAHGGTWAVAVFNAATHYALVEEHRARQLLMLTAEERYWHFLIRYPDLVGVLPQKDVGSYIGVTPVGISRIASRVREERRATGQT